MRTEVKIGVAIGLVVALVVVGYLVCQQHHNPQTTDAGGYKRVLASGDKTPIVPPAAKPSELAGGGAGTTPTPAPASSDVVPHMGDVAFPTPGAGAGTTGSRTSGAGTTGTTGSGTTGSLRASPLTAGTPGERPGYSTVPTPAPSLEKTYPIAAGDTLSSIAQKEYGEASKYTLIVAANPGLDPAHLKLGQKIKIPPAPTPAPAASTTDGPEWAHYGSTTRPAGDAAAAGNVYTVQDGDSLWTIAKKTYGDATLCTAIEKSNHGVTAATIHKGQKLTLPPLDEAQKLAGVSATPTTRPSTIASAGASGSGSASTRATGASTHASAASYVAVPADDGKPRFPVSN